MKVIGQDVSFSLLASEKAVPSFRLSNIDILKCNPAWKERGDSFFSNLDRRIQDTYGYIYRYVSSAPYLGQDDGNTSESLSQKALAQLIESGITKKYPPEFLIHGTTTSSRYSSTQSAALAASLGLEIPAPEVKSGCATGLVSMQMALNNLRLGYDCGLVVIGETLSRLQDPQNISSSVGLADAAAALVFSKQKVPSAPWITFEKSLHYTDGSACDFMTTRGKLPLSKTQVVEREFVLTGDEEAFHTKARYHYLRLIETILPTPEEKASVQWILGHQVNRSLLEDCQKTSRLSGKFFWVNEEYGNIGSVSIPVALHEGFKRKIFSSGDRVLLITVGGGMNCIAQLWKIIETP
jgi:3-oxoacyl-[acyl-carrier-protein] synthase III